MKNAEVIKTVKALLREYRRNMMLVGDSSYFVEQFARDLIKDIEKKRRGGEGK